ncbi:MAG: protein-L-isoaspartate O-methyltransferase [Kiloniellaceae bacterium]
MVDYTAARLNMVESQLRTNKVTDTALLEAFGSIPRELFVPEPLRGIAYVDEDIEVGRGRYLMEPMVLARLLQAAQPGPLDVVLDLGCGTGYAAAILARLAATVVAVESDRDLAAAANRILPKLGIDNAVVVEGPLPEGFPGQAPYHVILINGAVAEVPKAISDQLADGGRLVTVVKNSAGMGQACLLQRSAGVVSGRVLFDAAVPLLPGFQAEPGFVF